MLDGITDVVSKSTYKVSQDYQIVSISIDPNESNKNLAAYKKKYLTQLNIPNGWVFLKGSKKQIDKITSLYSDTTIITLNERKIMHTHLLFIFTIKKLQTIWKA